MTIVYFVASHTNPEQIIRLVNRVLTSSQDAYVLIHHDYTHSQLDPTAFAHMWNVHILPNSMPVGWGQFSLVGMTLRAFEWAIKNISFDWFVFLSGQDYPIQPMGEIERFLATTAYDGFMQAVDLRQAIPCDPVGCSIVARPGKPCIGCRQLYYYQYIHVPNFPYWYKMPSLLRNMWKQMKRYLNVTQPFFCLRAFPMNGKRTMMLGRRPWSTPFSDMVTCYKGSQWFTLNRDSITYIYDFVQRNHHFVAYYRRTLIPDESFFHTILFNQTHLHILNDNKRFISWRDDTVASPEILRMHDLMRIIASNQHFARKFDIHVDRQILDMLDQHMQGAIPQNSNLGDKQAYDIDVLRRNN